MKLTDYIANFLAENGAKHVFGLTGGPVVHLFDSFGRNPQIETVFMHHEQAASMAAEAYSRISPGNLGVCCITTGPGGTNAITGVLGAWQDGIPCIYISGQTRIAHMSHGKGVRQLGTQEFDIIPLVSHITKYAATVLNKDDIRYHLEKAVSLARSGRPGPVWLDIPLDMQFTNVEENSMNGYNAEIRKKSCNLEKNLADFMKVFNASKRPLILAGYGIHSSKAEEQFWDLVEKLDVPIVSTWNTADLINNDYPLYVGRIGMQGHRGGNLAVQNCDCFLALGSHLSIALTGTQFNLFAPGAKIGMVDIDENEHANETVKIDFKFICDVKEFISNFSTLADKKQNISQWREKCREYAAYNRYDPVMHPCRQGYVNSYRFFDVLSDKLDKDSLIVADGGGTSTAITFQAMRVKKGQRLFVSSAICSMGSGLPQSIGACYGSGKKTTISLNGDGGIMLNIQELQTISTHMLPIKIFIANNNGYLSIRNTQDSFMEGRYYGTKSGADIGFPDFIKLARTFGLSAFKIESDDQLDNKLDEVLKTDGPVLCVVNVNEKQEVLPCQGFEEKPGGTFQPRPLDDMYPYLSKEKRFRDSSHL